VTIFCIKVNLLTNIFSPCSCMCTTFITCLLCILRAFKYNECQADSCCMCLFSFRGLRRTQCSITFPGAKDKRLSRHAVICHFPAWSWLIRGRGRRKGVPIRVEFGTSVIKFNSAYCFSLDKVMQWTLFAQCSA